MEFQSCQGLLRQACQILRLECLSIPSNILSIWSDSVPGEMVHCYKFSIFQTYTQLYSTK